MRSPNFRGQIHRPTGGNKNFTFTSPGTRFPLNLSWQWSLCHELLLNRLQGKLWFQLPLNGGENTNYFPFNLFHCVKHFLTDTQYHFHWLLFSFMVSFFDFSCAHSLARRLFLHDVHPSANEHLLMLWAPLFLCLLYPLFSLGCVSPSTPFSELTLFQNFSFFPF